MKMFFVFVLSALAVLNAPLYAKKHLNISKEIESLLNHWDHEPEKKAAVVRFLTSHANNLQLHGAAAAVFDFDGTIIHEDLELPQSPVSFYLKSPNKARAFQPSFHLWLAQKMPNDRKIFPMFRTSEANVNEWIRNIAVRDDQLEGMTNKVSYFHEDLSKNPKSTDVDKFIQISTFAAGMKPGHFVNYVEQYIRERKDICSLAIYQTLDLMQAMQAAGMETWIITGSNAYVAKKVVGEILSTCFYDENTHQRYAISLGGDSGIYNPQSDRIIGNQAEILENGRFSMSYDDRFIRDPSGEDKDLYVMSRAGKVRAIERWVEPRNKNKGGRGSVIAVVGNSGSDLQMSEYAAKKNQPFTDTLVVGINPSGDDFKAFHSEETLNGKAIRFNTKVSRH